jgi:hypothetical protein
VKEDRERRECRERGRVFRFRMPGVPVEPLEKDDGPEGAEGREQVHPNE